MAGLHEFPYFERRDATFALEEVCKTVEKEMKVELKDPVSLRPQKHGFTRYQAHLQPLKATVSKKKKVKGYDWVSQDSLRELPFSAGHRKILKEWIG